VVNKQRRKAIAGVRAGLVALLRLVEDLREEEDTYIDNNFSGDPQSDNHIAAENAAVSLASAYDAIQEAIRELDEAVSP